MNKKIVALILVIITAVSFVGCGNQENDQKSEVSPRPIVIQGAMDVEVETLVSQLKDAKEVKYGTWTYWEGTMDNYPVVVAKTEIGMTNAAANTVFAIEKFNPIAIINQGTSGGHDPALHRYDIVVGKKAVNFGSLRSERAEYGEGIQAENWIPMNNAAIDKETGEEKKVFEFEADKNLVETAMSVASSYENGTVVEGIIGSADEWNRELDRIQWIHETFGTSTEEMETASAAQIADVFDVPFVGIRILSNTEIHNEEYDRESGIYCQEYVAKVTKELIKQYSMK